MTPPAADRAPSATLWAAAVGRDAGLGALILGLTLVVCAGVLTVLGASPLDAYRQIAAGAAGRPERLAYVMAVWAPVLLCSAGLLVTFAAGLWNIGIEGQVVLGAVCATGALRVLQHSAPPGVALIVAAAAAIAGGALWALLAGGLRVYGNVSEIFGGLGLNFIAGSLTVYLVLGAWARPGIASTSGTLPFDPSLWLPVFAPALPGRAASLVPVPLEVLAGLVAVALVAAALRGTHFGLRLRAIGQGPRAAYLRGVPVVGELLRAFAVCGGLAGLAGYVLVTGAYSRHQLFPLISGGDGFLAILVVLLAGRGAGAVLVISGFFAAVSIGSLQLPLQMRLDSSLGGVLQSALVLFALLLRGLRAPSRA